SVEIGFDEGTNPVQRLGLRSSWLAPFARAKTGGLRLCNRAKEAHVGLERPSACATRSTKDASSCHRVKESGFRIAGENLPPRSLGVDCLRSAGLANRLEFPAHGNHRRPSGCMHAIRFLRAILIF